MTLVKTVLDDLTYKVNGAAFKTLDGLEIGTLRGTETDAINGLLCKTDKRIETDGRPCPT